MYHSLAGICAVAALHDELDQLTPLALTKLMLGDCAHL